MNKQWPRAIVGALIFDEQSRLFLMQSAGKYQDQWIIPGGKIDFGESIRHALIREIKEETNLNISNIEFCGVRELIEPQRHFVFLEHRAQAINPTQVELNEEATQFGWFQKSDLTKISIATPTLALINEHWKKKI